MFDIMLIGTSMAFSDIREDVSSKPASKKTDISVDFMHMGLDKARPNKIIDTIYSIYDKI